MKTIYNEGRVIGLSNFELYVRQLLAEDPNAEVPSEREWLAATLANGASMLLKVPSGTPAGYSDFKLPNTSKLCAGNTLVATLFFGSADFSGSWATRITSYGDLIINDTETHPVTPGQSPNVPGSNSTDYTAVQKNLCKEYSKIMWGICFQPGIWSEYGEHGVGMELTPDFTKPAVVRIKLSQATSSDIYILIQGFTDRRILQGTSAFESTMDTEHPQDGDFLGPESYPWANKIIFVEPSEILQFKEKYRLTHSITGTVDTEPIIDIDLPVVSNYYTTNNFTDSTKTETVSDISASPNGVGLLGVYESSSGPRTAPALYSAQISSTGTKTLYPVDVVAPGTVKIFRNQQLALNYSVLLKNVFGMYLDPDNSLSMYDEEGNVVSLGSKLEVSTTKPYVAKVSTGSSFVKTISLTDSVSGSDLNLNGTAGTVTTAEITWATLLSCLADNKKIKIDDVEHATSADSADRDGSNNEIVSTYGSTLSISDHTVQLKNPAGTVIGSATVPDNDTKYTNGTGLDLNGTEFSLHAIHNSGSTYGPSADSSGSIVVPQISFDEYGRMTSGANRTFTGPSAGRGLQLSNNQFIIPATISSGDWFVYHQTWTGLAGKPSCTVSGNVCQVQCACKPIQEITPETSGAGKYIFYMDGNVSHYRVIKKFDLTAVITDSSDPDIIGRPIICSWESDSSITNLNYMRISTWAGVTHLPAGSVLWIVGVAIVEPF